MLTANTVCNCLIECVLHQCQYIAMSANCAITLYIMHIIVKLKSGKKKEKIRIFFYGKNMKNI